MKRGDIVGKMRNLPERVIRALRDLDDRDNIVVLKKWYLSLSHREKAKLDPQIKTQVKDVLGIS